MEKVRELAASIAPRAAFPGQRFLTLAIFYYRKVSAMDEDSRIFVTKEVYPQVSERAGCKLETTEKAIYRAVEFCWLEGRSERLSQVIGRTLPEKPSPSEVILYIARTFWKKANRSISLRRA